MQQHKKFVRLGRKLNFYQKDSEAMVSNDIYRLMTAKVT